MDQDRFATSDKIVTASGIVLFISSFLPWFTAKVEATGTGSDLVATSASQSANGWEEEIGFLFGPLPALIGLVLAVIVLIKLFAPQTKLPDASWGKIFLGAGAAAALFVIIELLKGEGGSATSVGYTVTVSRSYGIFLATLSSLALALGGYLKFQEDPGATSAAGSPAAPGDRGPETGPTGGPSGTV